MTYFPFLNPVENYVRQAKCPQYASNITSHDASLMHVEDSTFILLEIDFEQRQTDEKGDPIHVTQPLLHLQSSLSLRGSGSDGVIKLLACRAKGLGFKPGSHHFNFRD